MPAPAGSPGSPGSHNKESLSASRLEKPIVDVGGAAAGSQDEDAQPPVDLPLAKLLGNVLMLDGPRVVNREVRARASCVSVRSACRFGCGYKVLRVRCRMLITPDDCARALVCLLSRVSSCEL